MVMGITFTFSFYRLNFRLVLAPAASLVLKPTTNGTTAIQLANAAGTSILNVDTTSGNVGIGTTGPNDILDVRGTTQYAGLTIRNDTPGSYLNFARAGNTTARIFMYEPGDSGTGDLNFVTNAGAGLVERMVINDSGGISMGSYTGTDPGVGNLIISGNVGIGTIAPANPLAVNRQADDGVVIDIEQADTVEGTISVSTTTVSYNAFVGSHYTQLKDGQFEPPLGAVVVSLGEIIPCEVTIEKDEKTEEEITKEDAFETVTTKAKSEETAEKHTLSGEEIVLMTVVVSPAVEAKTERKLKPGVTFDEKTGTFKKTITTKVSVSKDVSGKEYFTYVDTTSKPADKRVYGTWFGKMSNDSRGQSFGQDNKPIYLVAQVGLFKIRVTDTNGDIENGDYLETSSRPMEAQKQTHGAKINSTIAKAMIAVKWNIEPVDPLLGYKWRLVPCTF